MRNRDRRQAESCLGEEARLFGQAQNGCRDNFNRLMERHKGLAIAVARKQHQGGLSFAEVLQAGREGLWQAISNYSPPSNSPVDGGSWRGVNGYLGIHCWVCTSINLSGEAQT